MKKLTALVSALAVAYSSGCAFRHSSNPPTEAEIAQIQYAPPTIREKLAEIILYLRSMRTLPDNIHQHDTTDPDGKKRTTYHLNLPSEGHDLSLIIYTTGEEYSAVDLNTLYLVSVRSGRTALSDSFGDGVVERVTVYSSDPTHEPEQHNNIRMDPSIRVLYHAVLDGCLAFLRGEARTPARVTSAETEGHMNHP